MLPIADLLESANRVFELHAAAFATGERLSHEERLRQEALNLPCALNDLLVLRLDGGDGDLLHDVLQILIPLTNALHATSNRVVLFANDLRIENRRGRI